MSDLPGFGVQIVENLGQEVPVDPSVQTVLQEHTLVAITGRDHAAVHEVELDELRVGQVQIDRHQLTAASLRKKVTLIQNLICSKNIIWPPQQCI